MASRDRAIAELVTPGRLDKQVIVLRKLNTAPLSVKPNKNAPSIMDRIGMGYIEQGVEEKETVWFDQGYVINDQPRSMEITSEVMKHTIGFAVADTRTGAILREGGKESLSEMVSIADSAKVTVNIDMELPEVEEQVDEEEAEAEAAIAAAQAEANAAAVSEAAAAAASAQEQS